MSRYGRATASGAWRGAGALDLLEMPAVMATQPMTSLVPMRRADLIIERI
jgi:hypothetical protein